MNTTEHHGRTAGASTSDPGTYVPRLVSLGEGIARLGFSRSTAYRLIADDRFPIPVLRVGRRWYLRTSDIDQLTARSAP